MPAVENTRRSRNVPILYTTGTYYEVGFDIGRTFSGLINNYLSITPSLNKKYIPLYETPAGRKVYDETLECVTENFPQYVEEMQGTADGAKVPFYKLFLLALDDILPNSLGQIAPPTKNALNGCSSICCNYPGQELLGHTEDALPQVVDHFYLVAAHIKSDTPRGRWKVKEECFTSLCYAGCLPGFTMGYNHHGFIYTINLILAKTLVSGKTPAYFLTRALLAAENLVQAQQILRDSGVGAADGFSVNMTFLNQEGDRMFHNAEVGPATGGSTESALNILSISPQERMFHANKYLRLEVPQFRDSVETSSDRRYATFLKFPSLTNKKDVEDLLGDRSDNKYNIYREPDDEADMAVTVAVGIFDCNEKTWSIYTDNPKTSEPIVVLPLKLK